MVSKPSENPAPQEDNQASDTFIVKGHLQYPNQVPFTSGIVRAFDTELKCEDRLLGKESTIDPKGNYEITYTRDQLCLPHKASADLVVRVFADPKAADPIAESPTISVDPTARETTVDLTIRHKDYPGPSEYERFMETVIPYIAHIQVSKLKHPTPIDQLATLTDERSKVFLARKTQIALSDIHNLVTAAKLSKETKLAPELH